MQTMFAKNWQRTIEIDLKIPIKYCLVFFSFCLTHTSNISYNEVTVDKELFEK
jgi:hypothetical protein